MLFLVSCSAFEPLRRSDSSVHDWLLSAVPVGSSRDQLLAVAKTKQWKVQGTWTGHQPNSDWGIDGATVVEVYLGGYRNILSVDLDSFWAFDEKGALIDVRVRRDIDAP
jgi:hypothetical protein